MDDTQNTLRESLEASLDAATEIPAQENISEASPAERELVTRDAALPESPAAKRARDQAGRFAPKQDAAPAAQHAQPTQTAAQASPAATAAEPPLQRPTTWKKEYLPIWDKIARGEAPTADEAKKLAAYSMQREKEYATGVSVYRAEAQNAKHLTDALTPYVPLMQQRGMNAPAFIKTLGDTFHVLVNGSPQEKLTSFAKLAQGAGIPLQALVQQQRGGVDPVVPQLMEYIQQLEGKVNSVAHSWGSFREQQETQAANSIISRFMDAEKYPHFGQVRGKMGQLLASGFTQDLEQAYRQAVRMDDAVWNAEQERQAQLSAARQAANTAAAVQQARQRAVSPRSASPSGNPTTVNAKDVRSLVESAFDVHGGSRV
jgi:hypothetical protein